MMEAWQAAMLGYAFGGVIALQIIVFALAFLGWWKQRKA